ncbi:MAG: polysaccharide biosynthesis protein [Candidatus Bipolaricaulota bacterium]
MFGSQKEGNPGTHILDLRTAGLGEPVRIVDLARDLIRLLGFEPDVDIKIEFTEVRPGEKLFEDILTAEEGTTSSRHEKIYVARGSGPSDAELDSKLAELFAVARSGDERAIRRALRALVPTYRPEEVET